VVRADNAWRPPLHPSVQRRVSVAVPSISCRKPVRYDEPFLHRHQPSHREVETRRTLRASALEKRCAPQADRRGADPAHLQSGEVYGWADSPIGHGSRSCAVWRSRETIGGCRPHFTATRARLRSPSFPGRVGPRFDGDRRNRNPGASQESYENARASGNAGPLLHSLFQRAFRAANRCAAAPNHARRQFRLDRSRWELAVKIFGDLRKRKVLLLGAGETSERNGARVELARRDRHSRE